MRILAWLLFPVALLAACGDGNDTTGSGTGGDGAGGNGGGAAGGMGGAGAQGGAGGEGAQGGAGGEGAQGGAGGEGAQGGAGGMGGAGGGPTNEFPAKLDDGVWLIGWSGGLDHFSWLRFDFSNATQGAVQVLGSECLGCIPLFDCDGTGLFSADPAASSLVLQLPAGCNDATHTLTFGPFTPVSGVPEDASSHASISGDQGEVWVIYQYPESACAPDFTSCQDPYR